MKRHLNLWAIPLVVSLAAGAALRADTWAVAQAREEFEITPYKLDNGLQVILVENHSAPTVAVSIWYKVGGADDPAQRSGFAHLFEHMMFQGSANVPRGEYSKLVTAAGGNDNASTAQDRTNYFANLPANQLPLALWLEADRMRSLVVDADNFNREREVVKEEYRQRVENQPYGAASLLFQTIPYDYPPYQRPVIGSVEDLNRATVDEVRRFHDAFYVPNNAVLTVAGDIDIDQARDLIQHYFGDIPRQADAPALPAYTFAPQKEAREEIVRDRLARVPAEFIVYRLPPRGQPDFYAAVLLSVILGRGDSSRLARTLVDNGLASSVHSSAMGNRGPSMFYASLVPNPDVDLERLDEVYYAELDRIRKEGVTADELTKALNQVLTQQIDRLETSLGLAESVQAANYYLGDPRAVFAELDRYRAVTIDDIQRVAQRYLGQDSRNVVKVLPAADSAPENAGPSGGPSMSAASAAPDNAAVEAKAAISMAQEVSPPAPLPASEFSLPDVVESKLENGLTVIVIPKRDLPNLTMEMVLSGGGSAAPTHLPGLADFTASLLTRGTKARSAQDLAQTIEQLGGRLSGDATNDMLSVSVSALSNHSDLALDILGDVVLNPSFPQTELDMERQRTLTQLEATLADPGEVAQRVFTSILYGQHPYGQLETRDSIEAILRDDVVRYYESQLNPQQAMLVMAGDIAPDDALAKAQATFGKWTSASKTAKAGFPTPPDRTTTQVYLVDRPGSTQAELFLGNLGMNGASPERYSAQVANQVLGAGATSRLFRDLRENRGYTYGVYSAFSFPRDKGMFLVRAAVRNEVAEPALRAILDDLAVMGQEPVPVQELQDAKQYLTGSLALRMETASDLANQVISLKLRGLPASDLRLYPQRIGQVADDDVLQASGRYIRPDAAAVVVVGDAAKIKDGLQKIAPVTLVDANGREVE